MTDMDLITILSYPKVFIQGIRNALTFVKKYIYIQNQLYQSQQEILQLKDEVARLKDLWKQEQDVEEHPTQPFITFKGDPNHIKYCANCWHELKIKTRFNESCLSGTLKCPRCHAEVCGKEYTGIEPIPLPRIIINTNNR